VSEAQYGRGEANRSSERPPCWAGRCCGSEASERRRRKGRLGGDFVWILSEEKARVSAIREAGHLQIEVLLTEHRAGVRRESERESPT
jgi:hypothetical protein